MGVCLGACQGCQYWHPRRPRGNDNAGSLRHCIVCRPELLAISLVCPRRLLIPCATSRIGHTSAVFHPDPATCEALRRAPKDEIYSHNPAIWAPRPTLKRRCDEQSQALFCALDNRSPLPRPHSPTFSRLYLPPESSRNSLLPHLFTLASLPPHTRKSLSTSFLPANYARSYSRPLLLLLQGHVCLPNKCAVFGAPTLAF